MATIGKRGNTWTNADGLVVGYGTTKPSVDGADAKNYAGVGGLKVKKVVITSKDLANVTIPMIAGSTIIGVSLDVESAFVGGTSLAIGISGTTDGFLTPAAGATANLGAGKHIVGKGSLLTAGTDTTAPELYVFASAANIILTVVGTYTAGVGSITVSYI